MMTTHFALIGVAGIFQVAPFQMSDEAIIERANSCMKGTGRLVANEHALGIGRGAGAWL